MQVRITEKSRVLVDLPMTIFLRLADGDGKMTAREMERFNELLASRDWCRSNLLQRSLINTESEKAVLWTRYVAGELNTETGHVSAALDTVFGSVAPDERPNVEHDLLHFCRELLKAAHGSAGLFRRDVEAKAAFDELLDLVKRPSARAARKPDSEAAGAEPIPKQHGSGSLIVGDIKAEMFWQGGKLPLHCTQIVDETHDVKTFHFVAEPPKLFRYFPGQFVTFDVPIGGEVVRRSYTISASPSRPYSISVTVKRADGGRVSNWLHDNLRVGALLFADGPHGKFTCIGDDGGPYLLISGGSGATPGMAISRWLCDTTPGANICFLHFARTPDDFIFEHELRLMQRHCPRFRCVFVCSRTDSEHRWTGPVGHISPELLTEMVPDLKSRRLYLCGPVPFMEATRGILEKLNFDMARFHQESFGGVPRDAKAIEAQASRLAKVVFSASKIEVDCKESDYVLDLALDRGLQAAFSCRAGQCGTCKVTLLEGTVAHDCTDSLTADDVENGLILACQARPIGTIVIDQ